MTSSRRVAEEPRQNGAALSNARLHGCSSTSLASDGLGRQIDASDRSTDGYGTSNTEELQRPARAGALLPDTSLEDIVQDSPFLDLDSPMTAYEWFKTVLLAPWAAFKFIVSVLGLILVWAITRLLVIGVKPNEPASPWRFKLLKPWLSFWTGLFLHVGLGFWTAHVKGWENFKDAQHARAICVFNHVSYVDAIVMTHFFTLSGVAKASVANIPFIGSIAVALQFLFVQRRGSADARNKHTQLAGKTIEKIGARAADNRFPLLMIAPEGTTKFGHCLLRFSTGAFVPGRPILPILLKYRSRHFNVGWGITYNLWHLFRLLTQFVNYLEVVVLPVYHPSDEEAADPRLYAANVRKLMAKELGATLSDHGLDHNVALKKAHVHVNFTGTKVIMATPRPPQVRAGPAT